MPPATTLALLAPGASAQTNIVPPDNNYTPAQDVEMGRQAAADARKQLPLMRDDNVTSFVEGHRAAAGPRDSPPSCGIRRFSLRSRS